MSYAVLEGDCVEAMQGLDPDSVDAIVTDPPYGLEFMGKEWDRLGATTNRSAYDEGGLPTGRVRYGASTVSMQSWHQAWATEALRILKPGGHLLVFGGSRTFHRLACAVEDAGFEIRDSLIFHYGSGFPKSLDVSKAIDKAAGVEREVVGKREYADGTLARDGAVMGQHGRLGPAAGKPVVTAPATPEAEQWQGWGTALKPSHEPIVMARKPLIGTVAANVLEHGTGALNIDGCRIGTDAAWSYPTGAGGSEPHHMERGEPKGNGDEPRSASAGRWPANTVLSHSESCEPVGTRKVKSGEAVREQSGGNTFGGENEKPPMQNMSYAGPDGTEAVEAWNCAPGCPVAELDRQSGASKSSGGSGAASGLVDNDSIYGAFSGENKGASAGGFGDTGGASRFFYTAKASRAERNAGLEGFALQQGGVP